MIVDGRLITEEIAKYPPMEVKKHLDKLKSLVGSPWKAARVSVCYKCFMEKVVGGKI